MKRVFPIVIALLGIAVLPAVAPAAEPPAATAAAVNVSGTWDAVVETEQGSGTPVFTLQQDGEKITGKYQGQFGESALTGTMKGSTISFSFTIANAGDLKIEYTGTVAGDKMKGTAKFGPDAQGTFTAKKRAK